MITLSLTGLRSKLEAQSSFQITLNYEMREIRESA
jgi:hypothetical protein